jgi:hypothetical protein
MTLQACSQMFPREFHGVLKHTSPENVLKEKLLQQEPKLLQFFQALLKTPWTENRQLKALTEACKKAISKKNLSRHGEITKAKLIKLYNETVQKHFLPVVNAKAQKPAQPKIQSKNGPKKASKNISPHEKEIEQLRAKNKKLESDLLLFKTAFQKSQHTLIELRHEIREKDEHIEELQEKIAAHSIPRKVRFAAYNQIIPIPPNNKGIHATQKNQEPTSILIKNLKNAKKH